MAVETTGTEATFTGTGVLSTYAAGFYANSSDQIKVYVDGLLQTLGDDYTLNSLGSQDGVDILANFASGTTVRVARVTPITQLIDTQNNETILEDVLDAEFDKLTMICQEINSKAERALAAIAAGDSGLLVNGTAAEALNANDFVNIFYSGGAAHVRRSDADVEARYVTGFITSAADIGDTVQVALAGVNPVTTALNGEVWMAAAPGAFTTTPPSTSGQTLQSIGTAIPGVGIIFNPQGRIIL